MKKILVVAIAVTLGVFTFTPSYAQSADAVLGQYVTDGGKSVVEIYKCGSQYCGRIISLKEPKDAKGNDKLDVRNADPAQRGRKIVGLNVVWGFNHAGGNVWENGKIYDPEGGKTYSCKMTLNGNVLNVRGFVGVAAFGKTATWRKK